MNIRMLAAGLAVVLSLAGCGRGAGNGAAEVVVSAAASLQEVMQELAPRFEQAHPGVKLRLNYGSSGALQQQIEQGAPVDLFISAGPAPMQALVQKGLVDPAAVQALAANQVVLVRNQATGAAVRGWDDLTGATVRKVALGNPQHVPAGQYGRAVLEHLGLWAAVQGRLVLAEDVRQVLSYVESGEVQAGIVYRTDVARSARVAVAAAAPPGSHPPVTYPLAVLKESRQAAPARALAEFLLSPAAQAVLQQSGFRTAQ